ncbi:MAG: DGQHR domain-containing protein [Gemmataceae bacterium]|nr:DGQHR domain-containing protein [Gemmataceae bacterium]
MAIRIRAGGSEQKAIAQPAQAILSKPRFLGSLVIAAWSGEPQYTPLTMEDPDGMLAGLDREFGVLTFDGTQAYFVLDGQHRLRAIKDAIKKNPELGGEDICVLIVTHYDTPEGKMRTRRLFSNINRNAKQTGQAENVALDEDDGFAILTRQPLEYHEFLREDGRVRVILSVGEEGELKLASSSVPKTDPRALTTFTVLYDVLRYLGFDLPGAVRVPNLRPSDEVLEQSYTVLTKRIDDLLKCCGDSRARLEAAGSAREVRAPKNAEGEGHSFMRPVVQKAVARVASEIMQQKLLTWEQITERLSELDWRLAAPPFETVFSVDGARMLGSKEHTNLLCDLLHAHLAPTSMQAIKRARKTFKDLRNKQYPVPEEELARRLPKDDTPPPDAPVVLPREISEETIVLPQEGLSEPEAEAAPAPSGDGATATTAPPVVAEPEPPPGHNPT